MTEESIENNDKNIEKNTENNVFAYLERTDFTSEKFKIEIRGLPRFYGIGEIKKLLKDKLKLDVNKIKVPRKGSQWIYVCFRDAENRKNALELLNGYKWKNSTLSAVEADAAPDPLVKKRKENADNNKDQSGLKKLKVNQTDQLLESTIPYHVFAYEKQLELKQTEIEQVLKKLGNELCKSNSLLVPWIDEQRKKFNGLPCELWSIRSGGKHDGYRTKCEFTVGMDFDTQLATVGFRLGSYVNGFTGVAPIDNLIHIPQRMKVAVQVFQDFVRNSTLRIFNPELQQGEWKQLTARWATATDQLMLIVGVQTRDLTDNQVIQLKNDLVQLFDNGNGSAAHVNSLYFKVIQKRGPNEPVPEPQHLSGASHIYEELLGLQFRISADAFFQVNSEAAAILYSSAIELTQPTKQTSVVDIFCGTGTIGLCFAKHCGQVLGVELIENAVADAKFNTELNSIANAEFFQGKAEDILLSVMRKCQHDNVIAVVDPPRAGLHQKAIIQLRQTRKLHKLLYVSCDPNAALKNFIDLGRPPSKTLQNEPFIPVKAVAVDLFPHTKHCELLIYFERISKDLLIH